MGNVQLATKLNFTVEMDKLGLVTSDIINRNVGLREIVELQLES